MDGTVDETVGGVFVGSVFAILVSLSNFRRVSRASCDIGRLGMTMSGRILSRDPSVARLESDQA